MSGGRNQEAAGYDDKLSSPVQNSEASWGQRESEYPSNFGASESTFGTPPRYSNQGEYRGFGSPEGETSKAGRIVERFGDGMNPKIMAGSAAVLLVLSFVSYMMDWVVVSVRWGNSIDRFQNREDFFNGFGVTGGVILEGSVVPLLFAVVSMGLIIGAIVSSLIWAGSKVPALLVIVAGGAQFLNALMVSGFLSEAEDSAKSIVPYPRFIEHIIADSALGAGWYFAIILAIISVVLGVLYLASVRRKGQQLAFL